MNNTINKKDNVYIIHTDGGSRGNPGPAAVGVVISAIGGSASGGEKIIWKKEYSEYIGKATNNEAEYYAVIFALKKTRHLIGKAKSSSAEIEFKMDSELAVKQLTGKYKLMERHIREAFVDIWNLKIDFGKVDFSHVPREQNKEADKLVNFALDQEINKLL
ncbi:MAG: hypothetical protein COV29_03585 [Candidatus Yanofskybacteria bacterium CG10_big_fil_rev_8_21_14_0_10_36_16]|uniref:RNase H type-1 domain-containing protein n=1 Tax=Candidatus Yanofskybacteria bacterium CG10_big_fil_rev_8_21_14_0_10_36_16 TaxID=1975096 RepID=A0A2J0Q754_9BACT|nr:MAG: hypothetical protein COV29_03585 [Candidatus Yanofskybacteria bacterium CG10_big_fil_rev_8_21_14_0_10_36_16]